MSRPIGPAATGPELRHTQDPTTPVDIDLSDAELSALEVAARESGQSVPDLILEMVRAGLRDKSAAAGKRKRA